MGLVPVGLLVPELFQEQFKALRNSDYLWLYQFVCVAWVVLCVAAMIPWSLITEWHSAHYAPGPYTDTESSKPQEPSSTPAGLVQAGWALIPPWAQTGRCAECRFWTYPAGALEFDNKPAGDWKDCARVNKADSLMVFDSQGWHRDGGAVMTRSDFGCVQWERKP